MNIEFIPTIVEYNFDRISSAIIVIAEKENRCMVFEHVTV